MCPLEMVSNKFKDLQRQDINNLFMYLCSCQQQCAKQVVSDSPGLVDFATGLVNSVLNLPDEQVKFFGEFTVINPAHQKKIFRLYKVTLKLVGKNGKIKLTFFAP